MSNETRNISEICSDLVVKGEYEAAFLLEVITNANAELSESNVELLEVLEAILDTGLPRNREKAEKAIARARGETDGE